MAASEAAVTAVMETLGCERFNLVPDVDFCEKHPREALLPLLTWTERGCPVAVAAADAAVDADRASIQAETLREAADVADRSTITGLETTYPDRVARWLRARADRIEAQP